MSSIATTPSTRHNPSQIPQPIKKVSLAVVEGNKEGETFVTQRAGKIVQNEYQQAAAVVQQAIDDNRSLQSTLLLQKKKEMHQVQLMLDKKRLEFTKRMEECREKQEELKAKQKQIKERVLKFEKFLRENDAKRQRANLKAQTEKKLREQKELELIQLQNQLVMENEKAKRIVELIKHYQVYERYLQSVVDILPPDYLDVNEPHMNDIIMRHKTLIETNEDLMNTIVQCQDDIDKRQKGLQELIKEKNDQILVYNSLMGTQQKKLDKLKQEVAYLEQKQEDHDKVGKERMRIWGESTLAINNLFDRVNTSGGKLFGTLFTVANGGIVVNGNNGTPAKTGDAKVEATHDDEAASTTQYTLVDKLNTISQRILDLQGIQQKAEQIIQIAEKNAKLKAAAQQQQPPVPPPLPTLPIYSTAPAASQGPPSSAGSSHHPPSAVAAEP